MRKLFDSVFTLSIFLAFSACTPSIESKNHTAPKSGYSQDEDEVFTEQTAGGGVEKFPMEWNSEVNTEDFFELISNMLEIYKSKQNTTLRRISFDLVERFEEVSGVTNKAAFNISPYVELLVSKASPMVRNRIAEIDTSIEKDMTKLLATIDALDKEFSWPAETNFEGAMVWIQSFVDMLVQRIPKLEMIPQFEAPLKEQLKTKVEENILLLKKYNEKLQSPKKLSSAINTVQELIKEFGYEPDASTEKLLTEGAALGKKIDEFKDSDKALKALLHVWLLLDEQGRKEQIKTVSPDLYDFLNGKSEGTIRCMMRPGCSTPFNDVIAGLFIEPKIEKYGLAKLRKQLNEGAHAFTVAALQAQVTAILPTLAKKVTESISNGVAEQRRMMQNVSSDVVNKVYIGINGWAKNNLDKSPTDLYSYEKPLLNINLDVDQKLNISPVQLTTQVTSSAAIGSSLNAYSLLLSSRTRSDKQFTRLFLNQLNKVLGFGGVAYRPDYIRNGLIRSLETSNPKFDIYNFQKAKESFSLVDNIPLVSEYTANTESFALSLNARSQSILFDGMLNFMSFLKDWEVNEYDKILGNRDAAEIFPSLTDRTDEKMFPKDLFFALTFAHSANMLTNIKKEKTPVIVFAESGLKLWANQTIPEKEIVTMAGVVDIKNGVRSDIIRSQNLSRWILSYERFLKKTEDLEKTKVADLIKRDETGKNAVDLIRESRGDISNLILGMGNLLSSQMIKDGQVIESIKISDLSDISSNTNLADQLLAIEALVAAHEVTKMRPYIETAKSIYKNLRSNLNLETNFYEIGNVKTATPLLVSQMIRSLSRLMPYLKEQQQNRLKYQIKVWTFKLERIL